MIQETDALSDAVSTSSVMFPGQGMGGRVVGAVVLVGAGVVRGFLAGRRRVARLN